MDAFENFVSASESPLVVETVVLFYTGGRRVCERSPECRANVIRRTPRVTFARSILESAESNAKYSDPAKGLFFLLRFTCIFRFDRNAIWKKTFIDDIDDAYTHDCSLAFEKYGTHDQEFVLFAKNV